MRAALWVLLVAACGDNQLPRDETFTGLSGSRIKLQWYLYQDGTRQLETAAFYDAQLHVRCERTTWVDGVSRCAPVADPTVFRDAACTLELGSAKTSRTPKFFVGYDRVDGELRAARLLRAGAKLDIPPTEFFEKRDGACVSIPEPPTFAYYELPIEVDIGGLAEVWTDELAGERLALQVIASAEGLAAPIGYRDHALDLDCQPALQPDGTSACVPAQSTAAAHFADPYCEDRVVVAPEAPRAVGVTEANGCATYHASSAVYTGLLFRRDGATCVRAVLGDGEHAYRVGPPLALAAFDRVVENVPKHRLQRIALTTGTTTALDARLYDTATRTECKSYGNGELAVCVPTSTVAATRLYANEQCSREVIVADLPRVQCTRSAFAIADDVTIHAISTPYDGALYTLNPAGECRPRPAAGELVPYAVGPAIPPATFMPGVVFSER